MLDGTLRLLCTYILTSVLAIAVVFLPLSASAESWRESGCAGVVEAELKKLDISKLGKPDVNYIVSSRSSAASDGSEELNGWVGFENCKGNLTVQLSRNCQVTATYTSGACRIPGVPHF
ncbi:MAG: hypothetical protein CMN56_05595 [Sneathiella sp.]|uniref:hypothetical protein n=1 Tax=Sneathiella sp. TaxID=1964365 RepID=UPI000C6C325F|nr:hypothetical protein [Sneathiella sp.]MAZ02594.1 hypothetical protein [Sneathiella sp.]